MLRTPQVLVGMVAVLAALAFAYFTATGSDSSVSRLSVSGVSVQLPEGWKHRSSDGYRLILGSPQANLSWGEAYVNAPRVRIERVSPKDPVRDFAGIYGTPGNQNDARGFKILQTAAQVRLDGRSAVALTYSVKRGSNEIVTQQTTARIGSDVVIIYAEAPVADWPASRAGFEELLGGLRVAR